MRLERLALAVLLLAAGCGPGGTGPRGKGGPPPVTVELFRVESQTLRDVESFTGQLDAENSVLIKPETDGVVASVDFEEGEAVEEGDVLVRLRSEEQEARLAEARANLDLAEEVHARTRQLVTRDAASQAQKDRSVAELGVARARVDLARVALERTRIRAPFDGVVGQRFVAPGDRVTDETAIVQIDAVHRLQLSFTASEQGVRYARLGAPIEISVGPYPGEKFPGEIFFVSPTLDPATRRLLLKAWVPNEDGRLRPGLFANVDLELARREEALLIPEAAVVYDREGTYVWQVGADRIATRVPIEVGLRRGGMVEVELGLEPGAEIVSAGIHKVSEGSAIAVRESAGTRGQALREPTSRGPSGKGT